MRTSHRCRHHCHSRCLCPRRAHRRDHRRYRRSCGLGGVGTLRGKLGSLREKLTPQGWDRHEHRSPSACATPWLIGMQRFGPPPSCPTLKITGLNAPRVRETLNS
jgi:hypothetical protein